LSNTAERALKPVIVTMGEPSGIGPEAAVKAWVALSGAVAGRKIRLMGSSDVFQSAAKICGADFAKIAGAIDDIGVKVRAEFGKPSGANARAVTDSIARAVKATAGGEAAAVVTAPINKAVLTESGFGFPGHTEFLASLTGAKRGVMMLAGGGLRPSLRTVPLTIHVALKDVFPLITREAIVETGEMVLRALKQDFGCAHPRLAVAGLNPHAGEDGTIGREEAQVIAPACEALRAKGHTVLGPLPPDTMFHEEARAGYDAALCMYHDQALIPLKTLAFWQGVNVTLGLPIVRTSPDHGTALNIAGRGVADARSMIAAIEMAADIATRRGQ